MTDVDDPPKVIQVTSAVPSEGKTTVALSLAVSAATSGLKVIVYRCGLAPSIGTPSSGHPETARVLLTCCPGTSICKSIYLSGRPQTMGAFGRRKDSKPSRFVSFRAYENIDFCLQANIRSSRNRYRPGGTSDRPNYCFRGRDKVVFVVRWASTAREVVTAIGATVFGAQESCRHRFSTKSMRDWRGNMENMHRHIIMAAGITKNIIMGSVKCRFEHLQGAKMHPLSRSPTVVSAVRMCGIAGAFAFQSNSHPINPALISSLNDFQRRRGPDGAGLWSSDDGRIVLGHRRLAIIDTGASGAQPMSDASGAGR